ncbi:MAG: Uma2 family endonuclease [Planctomyces sp.]|nr:Uma2 family endonuclease [Planctomyces sp.]
MAIAPRPSLNKPEQHLVLDGVTFRQFVAVTDALGERSGLRTSFDGQRLEFMTLSRRHEQWKRLLGRMIEEITYRQGLPLQSGGQTTFRSESAESGLEPDECYWIQHADALRGVHDWDPSLHPPPDLAVEIDVSHSRVDRKDIYARLGVDELWLYDGRKLTAWKLLPTGYERISQSIAFPFLAVEDLRPFLEAADVEDENSIRRRFLEWLHPRTSPSPPAS